MSNLRNTGWRTAFWICLGVLAIVSSLAAYSIIDQGVTLTYQREGYSDTESDLNQMIELINNTDLTKAEIQNRLRDHKLFSYMEFASDTISLDRILIIFNNNKLAKIAKQW